MDGSFGTLLTRGFSLVPSLRFADALERLV